MSDNSKDRTPLLSDSLTETQRLSLSSLKTHPGFAVLEMMMMEACKRATEAVINLDPSEEGYERKLKVLQSVARDRNKFCLLLLASIEWQAEYAQALTEPVKDEPAVNRIVKPVVNTRTE